MADQPSEPVVEARLREFLADELRRAEIDYPFLSRTPPRPADRRLPLGILLAAVAVIVFVVVAPRFPQAGFAGASGSPTQTDGSGSTGSPIPSPSEAPASVVSSSSARVPSASASAGPSASPGPSSTVVQPSTVVQQGIAECVRISAAACTKAITLARKGHESEVAPATRIVVDDTCPPPALCDRKYPFDAIVVFVTAGGDTTGWYSFHVYGLVDDKPTNAEPWAGEVPAYVVARLREPQPTP